MAKKLFLLIIVFLNTYLHADAKVASKSQKFCMVAVGQVCEIMYFILML